MEIKEKVAEGLKAFKETKWPPGELLPAFAFLGICFVAVVAIAVADAIVKKR